MTLSQIHDRQARYLDALTATFEKNLTTVVDKAKTKLNSWLNATLVTKDGVIARTPANMRALRTLDDKFMAFLNDSGYQALLDAFTSSFAGQKVFLQDTLDYISAQLKTPLPPMTFTTAEVNVLASMKQNAQVAIQAVTEQAARTAMNQAIFSVAGLSFGELVQTISEKLLQSVGRAATLAETSSMVFLRTMTDMQFQRIESELDQEMKYVYAGPNDLRTRFFCREQLARKEPLTRAQIDNLSNGQLPNAFVTCGGWACRHVWLIDTASLKQRMQSAA